MSPEFRAGFACFVGRPNAGKSTLTNAIVGQKIAITSNKPQTTRHVIRGVLHRPDSQLVLVDTPGLHRPRTLLGERLNDLVRETLATVDVIGFCVPADQRIGPGDRFIARELTELRREGRGTPVVAMATKTDLVDRPRLTEHLVELAALGDWDDVVPVSAVAGYQVDVVAEVLTAHLPPGLLTVLPGGVDVAQRLVAHPGVGAVSLTGGVAAGEAVLAAAGVKPVLLELGSNAANLVCADADLDDAAQRIAVAAFGASGQQCISAQRIIVERPAVEAFTERFVAAAEKLTVGDPRDAKTDIGPLVHERRKAGVLRFIEDAEERGAKLVLDGRADDLMFGPTVITDAPAETLICRDEVFGPVAVVIAADDVDHAIELANDSRFGLQAACFTRDLGTAMRVAEDLRSGAVWINESTRFRLDTYPFGGYGQSGIGREGVRYAMEALTYLKFVGLRPA
jgi:small GTP-binding protein